MTKFALRLYSLGDERHDKRHNDFHSNTEIKNLCVTCLSIKSPRERKTVSVAGVPVKMYFQL